MIETTIIGSGFSAFTSYLLLKNQNPKILSFSNINLNEKLFIKRKNLNTNKLFSKKSSSLGSLNYNLTSNIKLHDRLNGGGNTNIWGGFINISNLSNNFIKICNQNSIKFDKLSFNNNGYKSNIDSIRQLRDYNNNILNSGFFLKEFINGFLHSFEVKDSKILLKYINNKNKFFNTLETKKLILAISFPQLIDLLFRSGFIKDNKIISLTEFNHKFEKTFNKNFNNTSYENCVIKYDFLRALKHFLGYQKSLDSYNIPIPIYIDQIFSNKTNVLNLYLDTKLKNIKNTNKLINFGKSIHYCNLLIDNVSINTFLSSISKNIIGAGMSFVKQKKPGPISNDIVNNVFEKLM